MVTSVPAALAALKASLQAGPLKWKDALLAMASSSAGSLAHYMGYYHSKTVPCPATQPGPAPFSTPCVPRAPVLVPSQTGGDLYSLYVQVNGSQVLPPHSQCTSVGERSRGQPSVTLHQALDA